MSWTFKVDTPLPAEDYVSEDTEYQWFFNNEPVENETSDEFDSGVLIDGYCFCEITIFDENGRGRTIRTEEMYVGDVPPPEPWEEDVSAQTATFGSLTYSNAGGYAPLDDTGEPVPLLSVHSLVSGSLDGYTPAIIGGRLTFDGIGAPDGAVIRCAYPGGTVDITVDEESEYASVASIQEAQAVFAASHPDGGVDVVLRRGRYENLPNRWPDGVHYTAPMILRGEGDHETSLITLRPHMCSNIIFRDMEIFDDNVPETSGAGLIRPSARVSDCVFENLKIHGKHYPIDELVPGHINTYAGFRTTASGHGVSSFNSTIRNCEIYDVSDCIVVFVAGDDGFLIEGNVLYYMFTDGIKVMSTNVNEESDTPKIIRYNVAYDPLGYGTSHNDLLVQYGGNTNKILRGVQHIMNVAFVTGQSFRASTQVMTSFQDGPAGTTIMVDPIIVGNVLTGGGNHHLTIEGVDGGIFAYNVLAYPEQEPSYAESIAPRMSFGRRILGESDIVIRNNIYGGVPNVSSEDPPANFPDVILNDNILLGKFGEVTPYADVFVGEGLSTPQNYQDFIAAFTVKSGDIGGPGTSVGTYGTPGDASTWSFNVSVLED
ncbi:MAG: hypothetical protein WCY93_07315 [Anaerolineaceae bacterium]